MIQTNAIVLKTQPFEESGKMIILLTKDFGVQSAIVKAIPKERLDLIQATTPLFEGNYHLKKGRSDLYKIIEVTPIHYYHLLKQDFQRLTCATLMLKLIIKTQIKNKPIPLLYLLLSKYFQELEKSLKPKNLLLSFYLKFLRHEGLFELTSFCD
jgi:DNA repair protein RecO (recombination protein O)